MLNFIVAEQNLLKLQVAAEQIFAKTDEVVVVEINSLEVRKRLEISFSDDFQARMSDQKRLNVLEMFVDPVRNVKAQGRVVNVKRANFVEVEKFIPNRKNFHVGRRNRKIFQQTLIETAKGSPKVSLHLTGDVYGGRNRKNRC